MDLKKYIEDVPDFPKKGIIFKDISPLLANDKALKQITYEMSSHFSKKPHHIDAIIGIEARGFVVASLLANALNTGLVMLRKPGKLPPPFIESSYELEYGKDTLQIKKNPKIKNVVIVDDVLATGGTLKNAVSLCNKADYNVRGTGVIMDLTFLHEKEFKIENNSVYSILEY